MTSLLLSFFFFLYQWYPSLLVFNFLAKTKVVRLITLKYFLPYAKSSTTVSKWEGSLVEPEVKFCKTLSTKTAPACVPRVEDKCAQFVPLVWVTIVKEKKENMQRIADKNEVILHQTFSLKNSHFSPLIQALPPCVSTALFCENVCRTRAARTGGSWVMGQFRAMAAPPPWLWPQLRSCPRLLTDHQ